MFYLFILPTFVPLKYFNMAIVISFANNKGGVGKTTTTLIMGQAFSRMKRKTLLIDLDSQANLTLLTGDIKPTNHELTVLEAMLDKNVLPIISVAPNLDLIPANLKLANFDDKASSRPDKLYLMDDLVHRIRAEYDFILIDCPPALGTVIYNAFIASDYVVMVSTPDELSYQGLRMIYKVFDNVKGQPRLNPNLELAGTIITKYEKNKNSELFEKVLKNDPELNIIEPVIKKATGIAQALSARRCIFDSDSRMAAHPATQNFVDVAKNLALRVLTDAEEKQKSNKK